jgi:hypothetical protein
VLISREISIAGSESSAFIRKSSVKNTRLSLFIQGYKSGQQRTQTASCPLALSFPHSQSTQAVPSPSFFALTSLLIHPSSNSTLTMWCKLAVLPLLACLAGAAAGAPMGSQSLVVCIVLHEFPLILPTIFFLTGPHEHPESCASSCHQGCL